jgi:hypothetical protein
MQVRHMITCPHDGRYFLILDPEEIYPDDPGQGTPAMVYGPNGMASTYNCAVNEGELCDGDRVLELPARVLAWLQSGEVELKVWNLLESVE